MDEPSPSSTSHVVTGASRRISDGAGGADHMAAGASKSKFAKPSNTSPTALSPGLNWNLGNRPAIRTSLGRKSLSSATASKEVTSPLQDPSTLGEATKAAEERHDDLHSAESRARNVTASLDDLFSRDRTTPVVEAAERYVEPPPPAKQNVSPVKATPKKTDRSVGDDDVDEENDDLYGESDVAPSTRPQQKSTTADTNRQDAQSEDDSDILQLHTDDELDQGVMINVSESHELEPGAWYSTAELPPDKVTSSIANQREANKRGTSSEEGEIHSESPDDMVRYADANASASFSMEYQPPESASISTEYHPPEPSVSTEYQPPSQISASTEYQHPSHSNLPIYPQPPAPSSNPTQSPPTGPSSHLPKTHPSPSLTLADLNDEQLERQILYFYVGRDPHSIPLTDPARCEICMQTGHCDETCGSRGCTQCNDKSHVRANCPSLIPCPRCQLLGHTLNFCSAPLRAHPDEQRQAPCRLCSQSGHSERECEVLWRSSSPYPWTADLPIGQFRAECYECGRPGHLGNDCPTRRPGKAQGTMSWSIQPHSNPPRGPRSLSSRGRPKPAGKKQHGNANGKKKQFRYHSPAPGTRRRSRSPNRERSALGPPGRGPPGRDPQNRSPSYSPPSASAFVMRERQREPQPPAPRRPQGPRQGGGRGGASERGRIQIRGMSAHAHNNLGPPPLPSGPPPAMAGSATQQQQPSRGGKKGRGHGRNRKRGDRGERGGGGGGGDRGGRGGGGGGGGEKYRPMPSNAAKAWGKGFT